MTVFPIILSHYSVSFLITHSYMQNSSHSHHRGSHCRKRAATKICIFFFIRVRVLLTDLLHFVVNLIIKTPVIKPAIVCWFSLLIFQNVFFGFIPFFTECCIWHQGFLAKMCYLRCCRLLSEQQQVTNFPHICSIWLLFFYFSSFQLNEIKAQSREWKQFQFCFWSWTLTGQQSEGHGDREETQRNPDHVNYKLYMERL